jgi:hypothetical protein
MTNPADRDPRQFNQQMVSRIRAGVAAPYQEGGYVLRVASVPGRHTGIEREWPIAVSQLSGQRYVCAPNRRRDWVLNLLAAGQCHLVGDQPSRHRAVLIEDRRAAAMVATYLANLHLDTQQWPFPATASEAEIAEHLTEIAVFGLDPLPA